MAAHMVRFDDKVYATLCIRAAALHIPVATYIRMFVARGLDAPCPFGTPAARAAPPANVVSKPRTDSPEDLRAALAEWDNV